MSRGFTLLELMITISISSILAAAVGAAYLETRVSAARIEASLELEREASLATEWLRRDLRGASEVHDAGTSELRLERGPLPSVTYRIDAGRLLRDGRPLARRFEAIRVEESTERVTRVLLRLERPLAAGNAARIERSFVAVRLP